MSQKRACLRVGSGTVGACQNGPGLVSRFRCRRFHDWDQCTLRAELPSPVLRAQAPPGVVPAATGVVYFANGAIALATFSFPAVPA